MKIQRSLLLSMLCASCFAMELSMIAWSAPAKSKTPLTKIDENRVKAVLNSDGSITLKGTANYFDLAFGGSDTTAFDDSSNGIKAVGFGEHLYVKGETNKKLLDSKAKSGSATLMITPEGITSQDRREYGGWWEWYSALARTLDSEWSAKHAGNMQVLIEVLPGGAVRVVEQQVFRPGFDSQNKFVAPTDELQASFRSSIDEALAKVSNRGVAKFPLGSTAKSVIIMATFLSDHNLQVTVPDLRLFDGVPANESSQRLARICAILDAMCVYELSDQLRLDLPLKARRRFVPIGVHHGFYSKTKEAFYCISGGNEPLKGGRGFSDLNPFAMKVIDKYFAQKNFFGAEQFALALAASWNAGDSKSTGAIKVIEDHLKELGEVQDLKALTQVKIARTKSSNS